MVGLTVSILRSLKKSANIASIAILKNNNWQVPNVVTFQILDEPPRILVQSNAGNNEGHLKLKCPFKLLLPSVYQSTLLISACFILYVLLDVLGGC